jgi:hypothetical protein
MFLKDSPTVEKHYYLLGSWDSMALIDTFLKKQDLFQDFR